jgi:hypothetical protein
MYELLEFSGVSGLNGRLNTPNNDLLITGMLLGCITQMDGATLPFPFLIHATDSFRAI